MIERYSPEAMAAAWTEKATFYLLLSVEVAARVAWSALGVVPP